MKSFSITNFKAFSRKQTIPIKPITLIYGANSAGKSSVLQSYLFLNEVLKTAQSDVTNIKTPWDSLDIGGFNNYVYKQDNKNFIEVSLEKKASNALHLMFTIGTEELNTPARIFQMELKEKQESIIKFTRVLKQGSMNEFKISTFNFEHPKWMEYLNSFSKPISVNEEELNIELLRRLTFDFNKFVLGHSANNYNETLFKECFVEEKGVPSYFIEFLSSLFNNIWKDVWVDESINYIGPLRDYPPRVISDEQRSHHEKNHTWSILLKNSRVRDKVNKWLENDKLMDPAYKLKVVKKVEPVGLLSNLIDLFSEVDVANGQIPSELESLLEIEMSYDDEGPSGYKLSADNYESKDILKLLNNLTKYEQNNDTYSKLVLHDKRSKIDVSLRDVGVGISQVLPVLVNAYSPENKVVVVEQPEIHLHPKLQSELADVFIETALGEEKKTFLIETHSEHLLLRIMRRIRETTNGDLDDHLTKITANDVQVLFVMPSKNGEGSVVKKIALDDEGEMIDIWPGGFFEEGFNERFGL